MTACKPGMIEEDQNHFVWLQSLLPPPPLPTFIIFYVYLNSGHSIFISILPPSLLLFVGCCCFYFSSPPSHLSLPFHCNFLLASVVHSGIWGGFQGEWGWTSFYKKKKKYCVVWIENYICMLEGPEGFSVGLAEILPRGGGGRWKMLIWFPPLPTPSPFPFHIINVCLIFLFFFCMCKPLEEQWHRLEAFLRAVYECSCGVQQSRNIT